MFPEQLPDPCPNSGFASELYNDDDARTSQNFIVAILDAGVEGLAVEHRDDVMEALRAEGHTIQPGWAGENITVEGIDWSRLRPGSRVEVGDIPVLITAHAVPCSKIADGFTDRNFNRVLHERHPGFSRLYGTPLGSGVIEVGDTVRSL